jgi:DNA polymerase-4
VAELAEPALVTLLGRAAGRQLHALAHNRDPRPVRTRRRRGSIGAQRALGRSPATFDDLDASLIALVDRVTTRMRRAGRMGRTVTLRLRFDDFTRATRSHTLPYPTSSTQAVLTTARGLLAIALPLIVRRGITLVGISVGNLSDAQGAQRQLPLDGWEGEALDAVLDEARQRFGTSAVTRAVLVGRRRGVEMPLLPD